MSFADPQSVTIDVTPYTLAETSRSGRSSIYSDSEGNVSLSLTQNEAKRARRAARLTFNKVAADPFVTGVNVKYSTSVTLVIDEPLTGFTNTEMQDVVEGFLTYLSATSYAAVTKLLAGES